MIVYEEALDEPVPLLLYKNNLVFVWSSYVFNKYKNIKNSKLMPTAQGSDEHGKFYQWGNHGHKYYFDPKSAKSKEAAKEAADRQGRAAYANGYRGG